MLDLRVGTLCAGDNVVGGGSQGQGIDKVWLAKGKGHQQRTEQIWTRLQKEWKVESSAKSSE